MILVTRPGSRRVVPLFNVSLAHMTFTPSPPFARYSIMYADGDTGVVPRSSMFPLVCEPSTSVLDMHAVSYFSVLL